MPKAYHTANNAYIEAVSVTPQYLDVARGEYNGVSIHDKFGRIDDVGTATDPEDVWNGQGLYTGFPTTGAETLAVVSSDVNDTAAGTGARTVRLFGLDENYNEITEDVALNGTTPVNTTQTFTRMPRMKVLTAGSGGVNAGTLTVDNTTSGDIFAVMPIGGNRTQICAFTVPANKTCYVGSWTPEISRSGGLAGSAEVAFMVREFNGVWEKLFTRDINTGGTPTMDFKYSISFPEKTDIVSRVQTVSDNSTQASATILYVLVDND